jgi:hypothetical protein
MQARSLPCRAHRPGRVAVTSRRARKQAPPPSAAEAAARPAGLLAVLSAAALLVAALYCFMPQRASDTDTLSRLAMGRLQTHRLALPASDPFTFAAPNVRFGNPEWLGDLALFAIYDHFGESGLQLYALALGALGYLLALGLGVAWGADVALLLALLLCTLPVVGPRIGARNDLHTLWLLPAFAWLAWRAESARAHGTAWRELSALLMLGALWANLHGSFVLGALLLAALLFDTRAARPRWPGWCVLALYPALPWLGLSGSSSYAQLLDHLHGAAVYRALISEWRSPLSSGGLLAILPLHVIALLGGIALWRERARNRVLVVALFLLGGLLAYGSRRFLPLMAAAMVPAAAPAIGRWLGGLRRRSPLLAPSLGVALLVGYLSLGLRSVAHRPETPIWGGSDTPEAAAQFIAAHAPAGARLANGFDDGPWLLWLSAPRVRHYLDPRNNLGADVLARYVREVLPNPRAFQAESDRLGISLALLRTGSTSSALAEFLAQAPAWRVVYWDGHHALYARDVAENRALLAHYAFHVLRPTLQLEYLTALDPSDPRLAHDLQLLEAQSPPLSAALRGYLRPGPTR